MRDLNGRSKNKSSNNQILPGSPVEKVRRKDQEGVEPSTGLINTLADEVSRERGLEQLLVLEGVV